MTPRRSAGVAVGVAVVMAVTGGVMASTWSDRRTSSVRLSSSFAPWPLPEDAARLIARAELPAFREDDPRQHVHVHIDIYVDGESMRVPAGIGLVRPYSAVHTHSDSGIVHVETDSPTPVTLGQFFTVWGVRLSTACIGGYCARALRHRVFVNGSERTGDPTSLVLADGDQIAIVIGHPPPDVRGDYDCGTAGDVERESCRRSFRASRIP